MARHTKRIETEKCTNADKNNLFGLDCLIVELEYNLRNESNLHYNDYNENNRTYSSMTRILEVFLSDLRMIVEREGEKTSFRRIPEGIISLKVNILSDIRGQDCNMVIEYEKMFNSTQKSIISYKVYIELYSDSGINHHLTCSISVNSPRVFTTLRGLYFDSLSTFSTSVYAENVTFGGGLFEYGRFLVFSNSTLERKPFFTSGVLLFNELNFNRENRALPVDGSLKGTIIFVNSTLSIDFQDQLNVKKLWILNSTIVINSEFVIEEIDEVFFSHCRIVSRGNVFNRDFANLQISFANSISMYNTVFEKSNGKSILGIGESIDVAIINSDFNDHRFELGSIITMKNIRNLVLTGCNFYRNWAMKSVLSLNNVIAGFITNCRFEDNESSISGGVLFIATTGSFQRTLITSSSFIRNKGSFNGGAIQASYTSVHIHFSDFIENFAQSGGAIYAEFTELSMESCSFRDNFSEKNGGAVFISGNISCISSNFYNNSVSFSSSYTCKVYCGGSGGAIAYDSPLSKYVQLIFIDSIFKNNRAIRGGAMSLKYLTYNENVVWESVQVDENYAKSGGGFFFYSFITQKILESKFKNNRAEIYGNDMASSTHHIEWTVQTLNSIFGLSDNFEVFPGQTFSLRALSKDYYGSLIGNLWEDYFGVLNDSHFKLTIPNHSNSTMQIEGIFIHSTQPQLKPATVRFDLHFYAMISSIEIHIRECPKDYELVPSNYGSDNSYVCRPLPNITPMIVTSVVSSFVAFTVFLIVSVILGYLIFKLRRKVIYWKERDRIEKDVEQRLFETEISCTKEEIKASEEYNLARKNVFVIGLDQIHIEKKIGQGGAGFVYRGKWNHNTVAIKCLRVEGAESEYLIDEIEKEATYLSKLRHPNVLMFYGISVTPQKHYLIVEYLERGSLENLIVESRKNSPLSFDLKLSILIDIACGMEYLHSLKPPVIHRDLKSGNILLDSNNVAKVCDFGLSKLMSNTCQHSTVANVGTIFYMAVELFKENVSSSTLITPAIDVYSFGIILYELFFEERPYAISKNSNLMLWKHEQETITSPFSVLPRILKGERPFIPFSDEYGMDEYLQTCVPEYRQMSDSSLAALLKMEKYRQVVSDYFELMTQCWDGSPSARPNFTTIGAALRSMKSLLREMRNSTKLSKTSSYKRLEELE